MRFVVLAIALLCAAQVSNADVVPTLASLRDMVLAAQASATASVNAALQYITDGVASVATGAIEAVNSAANAAQLQVNGLVNEAKADGVSATECGIAATANITKITLDLPVALSHCFTDYLDAFDYYAQKIEDDFQDILAAIATAVHDSAECWVDIICQAQVYKNVAVYEAKKSADVAFQLLQIETAKINLVATIAKCDEEKKAQALLDLAMVVPHTISCIAQKRAELKN